MVVFQSAFDAAGVDTKEAPDEEGARPGREGGASDRADDRSRDDE
jgi:hypothetical protein